jgi:hypothetical protein
MALQMALQESQQYSPHDLSHKQIIVLRDQQDSSLQQLAQLQHTRKPIEEKIKCLQKQHDLLARKEYALSTQIKDLEYRIKDKEKEIWWQSYQIDLLQLKTQDLARLPSRVIDLIVKEKYGVDKLTFYSSMGTESGRPVLKLTPQEYIESVIYRITKHESCTYCRSIIHIKDACPELKKKICSACHESGHDQYHCTKQVKDLYKKQPYKKCF